MLITIKYLLSLSTLGKSNKALFKMGKTFLIRLKLKKNRHTVPNTSNNLLGIPLKISISKHDPNPVMIKNAVLTLPPSINPFNNTPKNKKVRNSARTIIPIIRTLVVYPLLVPANGHSKKALMKTTEIIKQVKKR